MAGKQADAEFVRAIAIRRKRPARRAIRDTGTAGVSLTRVRHPPCREPAAMRRAVHKELAIRRYLAAAVAVVALAAPAHDVAVLDGGDLVLLTWLAGKPALVRCNFRGEPIGRIEIRGAPADLAGFVPDRLRAAGGNLYLASSQGMRAVAISPDGAFLRSYDASGIAAGRKAGDAGFTGFGVDARGNLLFTVAPLFQAFVLTPDGELRGFGVRGSAPGRFNVVAGIAADLDGNLYVTDVLRAVVMVFDPAFEFRGEFGYRGYGPGNLIAPRDLVVGDGQVFVTQSAGRGVSVFRVEASPVAAGLDHPQS